jgi:hypothetical protein
VGVHPTGTDWPSAASGECTAPDGPSNWFTGETAEQSSVQYRKSLEGLKP